MRVFLIILAVIAVLLILLLNLSVTFTVIYEKGWKTKLSVLFFNWDIELSKLLSFVLFPEKKAEQTAENSKNKKKDKKKDNKTDNITENKTENNTPAQNTKAKSAENKKITDKISQPEPEKADDAVDENTSDMAAKSEPAKPAKPNPIAKIWNEEGIVGILSLLSNLLETANSAILTLIRGLHIYSLYVMIIVGGDDAAVIGQKYGRLCSWYYPLKGIILNRMRVDNYDDYIQPDFIAPSTEFEMQFIGSISVGLLLKMVLKAAIVFVKNIIKDKKSK